MISASPFFLEDYSLLSKSVILLISLFSNLFSSISGGGAGLIQLPALILFGIPYFKALASHKVATVALGLGGSVRNISSLGKDSSKILQLLIIGIPGVVFGANLVDFVSESYLYFVLGLFSITIGIYSIFKSEFGLSSGNKNININSRVTFFIFVFIIGILNGAVSSGSGLLVTILLIRTFNIDFLRSVRITLLSVGIFWNLSGAITLSRLGNLEYEILFVLIIGSFLGGFIGAHLSNLKGNTLIKKTFNVICLLIGFTLLIKGIRTFI